MRISPKYFAQTFDLFYFISFYFCFFRAALGAYGGPQARGQIGAVATGLHQSHGTEDSSLVCDLQHSSRQRQILNPASHARDGTCVLMDAGQGHYPLSHDGTLCPSLWRDPVPG